MCNLHARNTVRYYLVAILLLAFLFFSNDFGLIDVQKTAIVTAAGIDREGEEFILTSQIAVPQSSKQGKQTESVQLVSRGKTVAEAFEEINAKTGWYPKLVFCNLVILGKQAAEQDVFDALDFFLRDEYLTDDCLLAVTEGTAQELLNTSALIDSSSSAAISKILSDHAERVGSAIPTNLKDFSIGYFGDSQSGVLPVLKTQPQQDAPPKKNGDETSSSKQKESNENSEQGTSAEGEPEQSGEGSSEKDGASQSGEQSEKSNNKPVFSARETALFVRGRWVGTLSDEETFAVNAATGKLRLASYSVESDGGVCTLTVKRNLPSLKLDVGQDGHGLVKLKIQMVAGEADFSKSRGVLEIKDMGSLPDGVFAAAEKKLSATLTTAYEKARGVGCDVLGLQERLLKYKSRQLAQHKDTLLDNTAVLVEVRFTGVR